MKQLDNICTERKAVSFEYQHCVLLGFTVFDTAVSTLKSVTNFKYLRGLAALSGRTEACRWCQRCCILYFISRVTSMLSITGSYVAGKSKLSVYLVAPSQIETRFIIHKHVHW